MNGPELKRQLAKAKLPQTHAARIIGISERCMRKYCAARDDIPRVAELAIRYALHHMSATEKAARLNVEKPRGRMDDGRRSRYR